MKLKELSFVELLFTYELPTLVKYYLKHARDSKIYSLEKEEENEVGEVNFKSIGYLLFEVCSETELELKYVFIEESMRGNDYGKWLIKHGIQKLREDGFEIRVTVILESGVEQVVSHLLEHFELLPVNEKKIVTYALGEGTSQQWEEAYQPMLPLMDFVRDRMGVECVTIEDAPEALMKKILEENEIYFEPFYNPKPILLGSRGPVDEKCSYIAYKNMEPVAISIILKSSTKRAIFELIVVAKNQRNHGAFILPVTSSVLAMREQGYEEFVLCIYDNNHQMQQVEQQMLGKIDSITKQQITYKIGGEK